MLTNLPAESTDLVTPQVVIALLRKAGKREEPWLRFRRPVQRIQGHTAVRESLLETGKSRCVDRPAIQSRVTPPGDGRLNPRIHNGFIAN